MERGRSVPEVARPLLDRAWRDTLPGGRKTAHLLAAGLRRRILNGDLEVGHRLPPETELSVALDVSRETLREALRILESQSLIEMRRGRGGGPVVRRPDLVATGRYVALLLQVRGATLADLREVRAILEPPAAQRFAETCGEEGLDYLTTLHEAERAAAGDPLTFATASAVFDQGVVELSGNRCLGVIAGVLREIYKAQVYAALITPGAASATATRRIIAAHHDFLKAARRRDGPRARRACTDHLDRTHRLVTAGRRGRRPIDITPWWRAQFDDHPRHTSGTPPGHAGDGTAADTPDRFSASSPARPSDRTPGRISGRANRHASGVAPGRAAAAVASEIRTRIADGSLGAGARLPRVADLTAEFGVSRPTLREGLRILETEQLLGLRAGERDGATIRHPSPMVAAQLAGTVLESRHVTLADFSRTLRTIEPLLMRSAAATLDPAVLATLHTLESELAQHIADTPRFVQTWRRAVFEILTGLRNPALAVVAEMLQWVRGGTEIAVAADAADLPWVTATNRKAQTMFAELVGALAERDGERAETVWAECLTVHSSFIEPSDLGRRLVVDLVE
ncbi:FadR/GntR family transcriptional regulator [Nocardia sp. alder85J]|uniref:FadR/GntR family transcriptional regulator n=1 Tax=Nocardia sp. alder85J TaxID=2862949 RepID=UPI001CD5CFD8|nr:GntR family transcriptional regulator [Nocardia sp. alder85J]MCX4094595.1 GntR family transcriptional regulator [Nocardia sp. alder85J]